MGLKVTLISVYLGARLEKLYIDGYKQIKVKFPEGVVRDHHVMMFDELKVALKAHGLS